MWHYQGSLSPAVSTYINCMIFKVFSKVGATTITSKNIPLGIKHGCLGCTTIQRQTIFRQDNPPRVKILLFLARQIVRRSPKDCRNKSQHMWKQECWSPVLILTHTCRLSSIFLTTTARNFLEPTPMQMKTKNPMNEFKICGWFHHLKVVAKWEKSWAVLPQLNLFFSFIKRAGFFDPLQFLVDEVFTWKAG